MGCSVLQPDTCIRRFSNGGTMRVYKLLFILVMADLLMPGHADAASYRLPADPIGPTSMETCKRLAAQYEKIIRAIGREASKVGDYAWEVAINTGPFASKPYYAKSQRLYDKSFQLRYKIAHPANMRCRRQVYAYERRLSAQKRAASNRRAVSNRRFISNSPSAPQRNLVSKRRFIVKKGPDSLGNVNNTVRNAPRQAGYSLLKDATIFGLERSKIRGTRATGAIDNIIETVNYFRNRSNRRTSANELNKLDYLGSMGGGIFRNPLQQAVFKAAMGQIIEINRSALKDFNTAFQKRDGGVPAVSFYLSQISAKSYSENLLLYAGIQGTEIQGADSQDDALTMALKASIQVLENIKKDRIEATRVAIAKDRQIKARQAEALKKQRYDEAQARLRKQNEKYRRKQYQQEQARRRARERQARLERERNAEPEPKETFNFSDAFNSTLQQMQNNTARQLNTLREQQRIQQQRAQQQREQQQRARQQSSQSQDTFIYARWCSLGDNARSDICKRKQLVVPPSNCVSTRDRTCGIK